MRREFSAKTKKAAWARCEGYCRYCGVSFGGERPHYHHRIEAALGGDNSLENCWAVHARCHKHLTKGQSTPRIKKVRQIMAKARNTKPKRQIMPGSKASKWKRKMDGTVERRS